MAVRPRSLTRSGDGPGAATLFAAGVLLLGTLLAVGAQDRAHERDRIHGRRQARADLGRLQSQVDLVATRAALIAATAVDPATPFRSAADAADRGPRPRAVLLVDPTTLDVRGRSGDTAVRIGDDVLRDVVGAAVGAAAARVAGPVESNGETWFLGVAPMHPPGTPPDLAARRAGTTAVVVTATRADTLLRPPGQLALWPGGEVRIGDRGGAVDDPLFTGELDVTGDVVTVAVGDLAHGRPVVGWVTMGVTLAVAALGYAALRRQQQRRAGAELQAAERAHQLEMIAETSASLQQSLDLAELLPTFCVTIADQFDLTHVAVLVADDDGRRIEAFRFGDEAARGVEQAFDLRRGWRSVGTFTIRSAAPLDDVTAQSLQALCDLLAVAVSNAQLFQREQQAATRLRELDALKNAFLGTVSHELRTSTTAVQGFGDLLTEHWDKLPEERRRELASRIRRQAGSLRHLVDDLLDYARLEHERLRVAPRDLDLAEHVSMLVESMAPVVGDHQVVVDASPGVMAWADPIAVERILANLLSNAGKYSPPGTTVTVTVATHGDRARLSVADQGPGIPAEERRRVFVRFYRLDNAETVRTRGAGIGLSILHDFAERSGADVTIDDAHGGGALVCIDFPVTPPLDVTDDADTAQEVRS